MLTGPLIFIGPLPVGRASDSHRGPVFLAGPDGQRGPDCPDVLFCRFHNRFHGLWGFRLPPPESWPSRAIGPRVPKTPGRHTPSPPPPPPWLRPWPGRRWSKALIETILINTLKFSSRGHAYGYGQGKENARFELIGRRDHKINGSGIKLSWT